MRKIIGVKSKKKMIEQNIRVEFIDQIGHPGPFKPVGRSCDHQSQYAAHDRGSMLSEVTRIATPLILEDVQPH